MEQSAPPKLNIEVKTKKVVLKEDPPRSLKRIQLADMLKDRIAYQQMRNEDLLLRGGTWINNQRIAFSTDGKIIDEMK